MPIELNNVLRNPASVFTSPEEVLSSTKYSIDEKIEILRRWEYEARENSVASEEGMVGANGDDLLQRIEIALISIVGDFDTNHSPPTKQGGLDRRATAPKNVNAGDI